LVLQHGLLHRLGLESACKGFVSSLEGKKSQQGWHWGVCRLYIPISGFRQCLDTHLYLYLELKSIEKSSRFLPELNLTFLEFLQILENLSVKALNMLRLIGNMRPKSDQLNRNFARLIVLSEEYKPFYNALKMTLYVSLIA